MTRRSCTCLFGLALLLWNCRASTGDDMALDLNSIQGKWTRQVNLPQGQITLVKQHQGNSTTVTAYDQNRNVLYAHESEFKLERSGKLRLFTFFNRKITAGPNRGQVQPQSVTYLYRVDATRFVEVNGMLQGDTDPSSMLVWDRVGMETN